MIHAAVLVRAAVLAHAAVLVRVLIALIAVRSGSRLILRVGSPTRRSQRYTATMRTPTWCCPGCFVNGA